MASGTGEGLGPTAISGSTVFSGAPDATFTAQAQGAVFVFSSPSGSASGPEHEEAQLVASDPVGGDELGGALAVSGQTLVAGDAPGYGVGKLWVFTEPSAGWSGTVTQAATLLAPAGVKLAAPEISGTTIVARGAPTTSDGAADTSELAVFTEPAGGWVGTISPSAVLTPANGGDLDSPEGQGVAIAGSTIVAGAPSEDAVFVFTEPAAGWAGVVHESAELTGTDVRAQEQSHPRFAANFGWTVAVSGSSVLVGEAPGPVQVGSAYVFTEPAGGWRSETQTAELTDPDGHLFSAASSQPEEMSFNGSIAALSGGQGSSDAPYGPEAVYVYDEPSGGWSGTITPSAMLTPASGDAVTSPSIVGSTVMAGQVAASSASAVVGTGSAYVFDEPAGGWSGTVHEAADLSAATGTAAADGEFSGEYNQLSLFEEPPGGWASEPPTATLSPSGETSQVIFDSVSEAGGTAVAAGQSDAYVYQEPSGGWGAGARAVATLRDPKDAPLDDPVVSGNTVAALARYTARSGVMTFPIELFSRPSGGWSGTVLPSAAVVLPAPEEVETFAFSGQILAVRLWSGSRDEVEIFAEPSGGWSGSLEPTASLVLGSAYLPDGWLSIEGNAVIVGGEGSGTTVVAPESALVFTEPIGGWSGSVAATAKLKAPFPATNAAWVWSEPTGGWTGTVRPSARLLANAAVAGASVSGSGIALKTAYGGSRAGCPCGSDLYLYEQPASGWSGPLLGAPTAATAQTDGNSVLALDGNTVFFGGQTLPGFSGTVLQTFQVNHPISQSPVTAGPPELSKEKVSGLATGHPTLHFKLTAGTNAAPVAGFMLSVPSGLSFSRRSSLLKAGFVECNWGELHCSSPSSRVLRMTTTEYGSPLSVTIRGPALQEKPALRRRIERLYRYNRAHRHTRRLDLRFSLVVVDALGNQTTLKLTATFG